MKVQIIPVNDGSGHWEILDDTNPEDQLLIGRVWSDELVKLIRSTLTN